MKFKFIPFLLAILLLSRPVLAGVNFDGTDDRLTFGTSNVPVNGNSVSVFIVFKLSSLTNTQTPISVWADTANVGQHWIMQFEDLATDDFYFGKRNTAGGNYHRLVSSVVPALNTTYRIVGGLDSTNSNGIISVNGTNTTTVSFWYGASTGGTVAPWIGANRNTGTGSQFFNGSIYQVCIWNTLLTSAQANYLTSTSGGKDICLQISPSNLVRSFYLDDQPDGINADAKKFNDKSSNSDQATGDDGANNTGLTVEAEKVLSYT